MEVNVRPNLEIIEARCDYLTGTIGQGYKSSILATRAAAWQSERAAEGYSVKEFRWCGYEGETVDGLSWGSREDGTLIRLSGEMAHRHHLTALTFCSNVSRIDVEVTLRSGNPDANFAEQCHSTVQNDMRVKNGMTQTSIIRSTPRGTTAYIGSRASNRYFRCYDKTAESDGAYPNYCWRYEVEYKKERAYHVAQQVLRGRGSPENIRNIVGQAYFDYGYILPCAPIPMGWRDKGVRVETNDERRLAWLNKSIRPAIEKLSEGVPLGTILSALGLEGLIDGTTGEVYKDERSMKQEEYESRVPHPELADVYIVSDG